MKGPLSRRIDRNLPAVDDGPVYTFDIDKTYLDTQWSSALDLLKIPLEVAIDKKPFPGIAELIRACQKGGAATGHDRPAFFLSASPAGMRFVLERRMVLDGLSLDGMTLKNWGYFLPRVQRLKKQVFYKLLALLTTRMELPLGSYEILFGDDSESDAYIYSLYSAILKRTLAGHALEQTLAAAEVEKKEIAQLMEQVDRLDLVLGPERDREWVKAAFIHRLNGGGAPRLLPHGLTPRLYSNALEPAAWLFGAGLLRGGALSHIYAALRTHNAFFAKDALDGVAETLAAVEPQWRERIEDPRGLLWSR